MAVFNDTDRNFSAFQDLYQLCDESPLKSQELCVQVYQRHRGRQNMTL